MEDELDCVTDSMRGVAMRLYDQVLQAPGQRQPLKLLAAWLRQDPNNRLALKELRQLLELVQDDPIDILHRMVASYSPKTTLH